MKKIFTIAIALLFVGALNAQTVFFGEDFEAGLPMDWTAENAWNHGDASTISSQFFQIPATSSFMGVNDDDLGQGVSGDGVLISPKLDFSEVAAPGMSFDAYFINGDYGADETAKVVVSTDGGENWIEVYDMEGINGEWQSITVSLVAYAGEPEVWVGFQYTDGGGWNYGFVVDNISMFEPDAALDAELTGIDPGQRYGVAPFVAPLTGTISNKGANEITSLDINWTDGTDTYTQSMTDISIPPFGSMDFEHDTQVEVAEATTVRVLDIWISNVNGGDDENAENDNAAEVFSGLTFSAPAAVVAEEATGTWCGWCPRGHVFMEQMEEAYGADGGFIGIAVHGGSVNEPMYVAAYQPWLDDYIGGYPSGSVNRTNLDVDPSNFESAFNQSIGRVVPVQIDLSTAFNADSTSAEITIQGTFAAALMGDYRFSVVITENEVTGTGDGTNTNSLDYDQVNYYANNANGVMGGFEALGDPVPATDMVYEDVARAVLGGFLGEEGSLPSFIEQDAVHTYDFTYDIPVGSNPAHMQVVGLVVDARSGAIINGFQVDMGESSVVGLNDISLYENEVKVFPNPFNDVTNVVLDLDEVSEVTMEVFNSLGQRVASRAYGELSGEIILPFNGANFESGMYHIHLNINGQIITKKVMLAK